MLTKGTIGELEQLHQQVRQIKEDVLSNVSSELGVPTSQPSWNDYVPQAELDVPMSPPMSPLEEGRKASSVDGYGAHWKIGSQIDQSRGNDAE